MHVERFFGAAFVFNPARWPTADGHLPYRVCVAAAIAIATVRATESLAMTRATMLPHARPTDRDEALAALNAQARGEA